MKPQPSNALHLSTSVIHHRRWATAKQRTTPLHERNPPQKVSHSQATYYPSPRASSTTEGEPQPSNALHLSTSVIHHRRWATAKQRTIPLHERNPPQKVSHSQATHYPSPRASSTTEVSHSQATQHPSPRESSTTEGEPQWSINNDVTAGVAVSIRVSPGATITMVGGSAGQSWHTSCAYSCNLLLFDKPSNDINCDGTIDTITPL